MKKSKTKKQPNQPGIGTADYILAIDPGPQYSAFVTIAIDNCWPAEFGKLINEDIRAVVGSPGYGHLVIEECVAYGKCGREITDTAFEAGRMVGATTTTPFTLLTRSRVRGHICKPWKGSDSKVIERLIYRFEYDIFAKWITGSLTRNKMILEAKEGWFSGFVADIWQAYALGVCYIDLIKSGQE